MILLSPVTIILGTATLAGGAKLGDEAASLNRNMGHSYRHPGSLKCSGGITKDVIISLCGSAWGQNYPRRTTRWLTWIWSVWAVSMSALLLCVFRKPTEGFHSASPAQPIISIIHKNKTARRALIALILVVWCNCLGAQLLLFSYYFEDKHISYKWSFGQIIAVTVWIPSLIEFAYIEYSMIGLVFSILKAHANYISRY